MGREAGLRPSVPFPGDAPCATRGHGASSFRFHRLTRLESMDASSPSSQSFAVPPPASASDSRQRQRILLRWRLQFLEASDWLIDQASGAPWTDSAPAALLLAAFLQIHAFMRTCVQERSKRASKAVAVEPVQTIMFVPQQRLRAYSCRLRACSAISEHVGIECRRLLPGTTDHRSHANTDRR